MNKVGALKLERIKWKKAQKHKRGGVVGPVVIEWNPKTVDALREVFIPFTSTSTSRAK